MHQFQSNKLSLSFQFEGNTFHTFLPYDRVFGTLEKKLRKMERINSPEEYYNVFSSQRTVKIASLDWNVMNFK